MDALTSAGLLRVLISARAELAAVESKLNSLNVFPVPDGDTGTNMRMTLDAALRALEGPSADETVRRERVLRALTVEAQGNSGVILAEYVRGFIEAGGWTPGQDVDVAALVEALEAAGQRARKAVDLPVEGTILSVAQAAAGAARTAAAAGGDLASVAERASDAAVKSALSSTAQLPELTSAGVIDAGGAGLAIVLESLRRAASGKYGLPASTAHEWLAMSAGTSLVEAGACHVDTSGPRFELMAVLDGLTDESADALRHQLSQVGDSVVVAGGGGTYRIHVHTDDVVAAASLARAAGRMSSPAVTRFEGPLEAMSGAVVLSADVVLQQVAAALGAHTSVPPEGAERDAIEVVLLDTTGEIPDELASRVRGVKASLHVALELEALSFDAQWGDLNSDESLPIYRANSWNAAADLVRSHYQDAESLVVALNEQAQTSDCETFLAQLPAQAKVTVLRLTSEYLVQLAGE